MVKAIRRLHSIHEQLMARSTPERYSAHLVEEPYRIRLSSDQSSTSFCTMSLTPVTTDTPVSSSSNRSSPPSPSSSSILWLNLGHSQLAAQTISHRET